MIFRGKNVFLTQEINDGAVIFSREKKTFINFSAGNLERAKLKIRKKSYPILLLLAPVERKNYPKKYLWKIKLYKLIQFWKHLEMQKLLEMIILQDLENLFGFISTLKLNWQDVISVM